MTIARFVELLDSFQELPCGIRSEEFFDGELREFKDFCSRLLDGEYSFTYFAE